MRPAIVADGGDIHFVDFEKRVVFVTMEGACSGCGLSGLTLANLENKIEKALGIGITVFPVQEKPVAKKEATYDA
jgi:NifU-like protein